MIGSPIALRIRRTIERAPPALVRRFARVQTSFIADAQQGWNCLHHSIKPLNPKHRFAGNNADFGRTLLKNYGVSYVEARDMAVEVF